MQVVPEVVPEVQEVAMVEVMEVEMVVVHVRDLVLNAIVLFLFDENMHL